MGYNEVATHLWSNETEQFQSWIADVVGHVHCGICGSPHGRCYLLCPNSPGYYSAEQEREESLWQESLSDGAYLSLAVAQYERENGPGSYCS